jgi:hypothetical protein
MFGDIHDKSLSSFGLRCKVDLEWKLIECEQSEVILRLGSEDSLPELGQSGLAAAEWAYFELPLFDLLC